MDDATFALIYLIFALLFVYLNLTSLATPIDSGVHNTIVPEYSNMPYAGIGKASKSFRDVESPSDLHEWLSAVFTHVTFKEQSEWPKESAWNGDLNWTANFSPATVGSFNQIVLVRFTGKRWDLANNSKGAFAEATFRMLGGVDSELSTESAYQPGESSDTWCANASGRCYDYALAGTYSGAGGYSFFLNPQDGRAAFEAKLKELKDDAFFNVQLATFVVDMMVYNPNVDSLIHFAWHFSFNIAGNCFKSVQSRTINLALNSSAKNDSQFMNILKVFLGLMVVFFFIVECRKIRMLGFRSHFAGAGAVIDAISLLTCALALLSYIWLSQNNLVSNFKVGDLVDPSTRATTYEALEDLGRMFEEQAYIIGFNLLIVFVRATVLVAALQSNLGLMLKVVQLSFKNLLTFLGMFSLILASFTVMAYYLFGARFQGMSEPGWACYRCFSMMTGKPIYDELAKADWIMGPVFYFVFYIFFYLIMLNMFVSILLNGYDIVVMEIEKANEHSAETGPIEKLVNALNRDVLGRLARLGSWLASVSSRVFAPYIEAADDCYRKLPCRWRFTKRIRKRDKSRKDKDKGDIAEGGKDEGKQKTGIHHSADSKWWYAELFSMVIFLANFMAFSIFLVRGEDTYWVSRATLRSTMSTEWMESTPPRTEDFASLRSFEGVERWSREMVDVLYSTPRCIVSDGGRYFSRALDEMPSGSCSNERDDQQLVQRVADWNTAFLNKTFVRLTVQPACFVPNTDSTWSAGAPLLRATPAQSQCGTEGCMQVLYEQACKTGGGVALDPATMNRHAVVPSAPSSNGSHSSVFALQPAMPNSTASSGGNTYNFSKPETELGSHRLLGGFVFAFGTSRESAMASLDYAREGGWFSKNSASMVFDWVTFNGNVDRFTYNMVSFSLLGTGEFIKTSRSTSFPLNIAKGGGFNMVTRTTAIGLFVVYVSFVLGYIGSYILSMNRNFKKAPTLGHFLRDFFSDVWNVSDLVSLVLSAVSIINVLAFVLQTFRGSYSFSIDSNIKYQVPNTVVKAFSMLKDVDPGRDLQDDWYIFSQFETLESMYRTCLTIAALNSFFISIKIVKYVGSLSAVRPFSSTLNKGKTRNFYFAIIMLMGLLGFSFLFHIIFGRSAPGFSTWPSTILTIFNWIIGEYDLTHVLAKDFWTALVCFAAFMVCFYFIAVNMFLATMVNTYSATVGDIDIAATRTRVDNDKMLRKIEYPSKERFKKDIELAINEKGDFIVKSVAPDGDAHKEGVAKDHVISKINRSKDAWKRETVELTWTEGIEEDDRNGGLVTVFIKDSGKSFGGRFRKKEEVDHSHEVRATAKNFWRVQGAVSRIYTEEKSRRKPILSDDDGSDDEAAPVEADVGRGGDDDGGEGGIQSALDALAKPRARSRLQTLLFSRWLEGKRSGNDGASAAPANFWSPIRPGSDEVLDSAWEGAEDAIKEANEEKAEEIGEATVFHAEKWDIDDLISKMEELPVTGHEVWLDCLVSAFEREMADGESLVADVLRTKDMSDLHHEKAAAVDQKPLIEFYQRSGKLLRILEHKAMKKYFDSLRVESDERQEKLRQQNSILYEYVTELERQFEAVVTESAQHRSRKGGMLASFALTLDPQMYAHLAPPPAAGEAAASSLGSQLGAAAASFASHFKQFARPWQGEQLTKAEAEAKDSAISGQSPRRAGRR